MKARLTFRSGSFQLDEDFAGASAEALVDAIRLRVATQLGGFQGLMLRTFSPLRFAQESIRQYNAHVGRSLPTPDSCADFVALGEKEGFLKVTER